MIVRCGRCHQRRGIHRAYATMRSVIEEVLVCTPCRDAMQKERRQKPVAYTKRWERAS